jgi:hypothetical protein
VLEVDQTLNAALAAVTAPSRRRLARKQGLRPEQCHDAVRAWSKLMPAGFRTDHASALTRSAISITDLRLTGSRWRVESWAERWEVGVSPLRRSLSTETGRVDLEHVPLAPVSLHAFARRYQWGRDRTTDAVVADLGRLAAPSAGGADTVPTGTGYWLGGIEVANDDENARRVRVRTFVAAEQVPDGRYPPLVGSAVGL